MQTKNLKQIQSELLSGALTMETVVSTYLANIKSTTDYNAYIEIFEEEILTQAKTLDHRIKTDPSKLGSLFGLVISLKDNFCYEGHVSTAGSKILTGFVAPYSATVVDRLLRSDALIIGRTNCDELSMGSTNETSYYGPAKNAIEPKRVPGGSSGGGAVAVALDTCLVSLGSDTGGSIRQPAAFNGVVGYKPTYGAISRWGLIAYGSSFDTIGFLGRNISDLTAVMGVVSGSDDYDSTTIDQPLSFQSTLPETAAISIAYSSKLINHNSIDPAVQKSTQAYMARLEVAGYKLVDVDLHYDDYLIPTYYVLCSAEASSNLSRYDGIRYGHRTEEPTDDYKELIKLSRTEGFGKEVKKRIMLGTYVLSAGYYDAYFKKAQQVRALIKSKMEEILDQHEFFLLPTTTTPPWNLGDSIDPIQVYLSDMYTVLANLCGIPAISLPMDNIDDSFPLGIQLMTKSGQDTNLLAFTETLRQL